MREFAGMKVIENPMLERGQVLLMHQDALSLMRDFVPIDPDPKPYDKSKVPAGCIPVKLVTEKLDLFDHDRYRLNNALIDLFGTKPEPWRYRARPFWTPPLQNVLDFYTGGA